MEHWAKIKCVKIEDNVFSLKIPSFYFLRYLCFFVNLFILFYEGYKLQ